MNKTMKTLRQNIWYADEKRADSPKKLLVYSDKGILKTEGSRLCFEGEKTNIEIDRISSVKLKHTTLNWMTYLAGGLACLLFDFVLGPEPDVVFSTRWVLTSFYVALAPICILLFWLPVRWVAVEYTDGGDSRRAYFSSGDSNGFAVLFGANKKLKREVAEAVADQNQSNH